MNIDYLDTVSNRLALLNDSITFVKSYNFSNKLLSAENYFNYKTFCKEFNLNKEPLYQSTEQLLSKMILQSFILKKADSNGVYTITLELFGNNLHNHTGREFLYTIGYNYIFGSSVICEIEIIPLNFSELKFVIKPKLIDFKYSKRLITRQYNDINEMYDKVVYPVNGFYQNYLTQDQKSTDQDLYFKKINVAMDLIFEILEKTMNSLINENEN